MKIRKLSWLVPATAIALALGGCGGDSEPTGGGPEAPPLPPPATVSPDLALFDSSAARAFSVLQFFLKEGVAPEKLSAVGYGENHPIVPNDSEVNRKKNRRVVFFIKTNPYPDSPAMAPPKPAAGKELTPPAPTAEPPAPLENAPAPEAEAQPAEEAPAEGGE